MRLDKEAFCRTSVTMPSISGLPVERSPPRDLTRLAEARSFSPQGGNLEGPANIEHHHLPYRDQGPAFADVGRAGHGEDARQFFRRINGLPFQRVGERILPCLQLVKRDLGGVERAGNLRIQVAAADAAQSHGEHDPECHPGNVVELERGVKRNDDRRGDAKDDMEIHPVLGGPDASQPGNRLTQCIEEDEEEEECAEDAQIDADQAAGPQQFMLVGKGPQLARQGVVAPSVDSESENEGDGREDGNADADLVPAFYSGSSLSGRRDKYA